MDSIGAWADRQDMYKKVMIKVRVEIYGLTSQNIVLFHFSAWFIFSRLILHLRRGPELVT